MRFLATMTLALVVVSAPAKAEYDRHGAHGWTAGFPSNDVLGTYRKRDRGSRHVRHARTSSAVIGHRPAGCPHAYCGCALSIKNFGKIIPSLNIAANWKGFPVALPAPDMVAARTGHVFQLIEHVSGSIWKVYDPNSGGGQTRIHERSIAGYTIHNPRGHLTAYNGRPGRHARRHRFVRYARAG